MVGVKVDGIRVDVAIHDERVRAEVVRGLACAGFEVRGFGSARELYFGQLMRPGALVMVDLDLPDEDGLDVVERLRRVAGVGIVVLAERGRSDDAIHSLTRGADAYLVKPVDLRALAATLVSVHRRVAESVGAGAQAGMGRERLAGDQDQGGEPGQYRQSGASWRLHADAWELLAPGGTVVSLSASERAVLLALFDAPGRAVPRQALVSALGHHPDYYLDHRLDMLMSRLRRKVRERVGHPLPIKAVRGVGYMLSLRPG
ncbi:MAG: response regulator transcription factor [Rhodocyclaceae bacterium]